MVTMALGLDFRDCRNRGLKLVIVRGVCIGLTIIDVGTGNIRTGEVITISTNSLSSRGSEITAVTVLMLKAVKTVDYPIARYCVAGIWVPFGQETPFNASSYMEAVLFNALLC